MPEHLFYYSFLPYTIPIAESDYSLLFLFLPQSSHPIPPTSPCIFSPHDFNVDYNRHPQGVRQKSPNFELFPDSKPPAPKVTISSSSSSSSDTLSLKSGSLKASINLKEYSYGIRFTSESDHKTDKPLFLCSTEPKSTAVIDVPPSYVINQMSESSCLETGTDALLGASSNFEIDKAGKIRFMLNELSLTVGETIYGLGERFTPLVKNGGSHSIWNQGEPRARLSNQYSPREEDTQLTFGTG